MKELTKTKVIILLLCIFSSVSVLAQTGKKTSTSTKPKSIKSKTSSGRDYKLGPRGRCYYINSNGNKVYVDRKLCN